MDCLAIGDFLLEKHQQPAWNEMGDWRMELPLD
jgi:carbamoyltransferase